MKNNSLSPIKESVRELITRWFEDDNWEDLGLTRSATSNYLTRLIPKVGIIQAHFFPLFDADKLDRAHLIFITKRVLHHVYLGHGLLEYREFSILDVNIRVEFKFSKSRRLDSIKLLFDVGDVDGDGRPRIHYLNAPAELRSHAVTLVSIISQLKAENNWYDDSEN